MGLAKNGRNPTTTLYVVNHVVGPRALRGHHVSRVFALKPKLFPEFLLLFTPIRFQISTLSFVLFGYSGLSLLSDVPCFGFSDFDVAGRGWGGGVVVTSFGTRTMGFRVDYVAWRDFQSARNHEAVHIAE